MPVAAAPPDPVSLSFASALPGDFIRALCLATGHKRFMLSPDVVADQHSIGIELHGSPSEVWRDGISALQVAGIVERADRGFERFFVPEPAQKPDEPLSVLSYSPRYRTVPFLAGQLGAMFSGWHFDGVGGGGSAAVPGVSVAAAGPSVSAASGSGAGGSVGKAVEQAAVAGRVVGVGPLKLRRQIDAALAELDVPVPALTVRVAVYEVDTGKRNQAAVELVGQVLKASVSLGATATFTGGASLAIKGADFSAVLSALDSSSVAHLVTAPVLRASSGVTASFAVGDSVPTLGSVSYTQGSSTPVQSIEYQQSGVVFSILPQLVGESVDVSLFQSISSFQQTQTGVQSTPTLSNRALASQLLVRPGEVLVLGGLVQRSESRSRQGWWFVPLGVDRSKSETSIVLLLSVEVGHGG
jgi:hypothetical protein